MYCARLRVYKNSADFYKQHKFYDEELTQEEAEVVFSRAGKDRVWTLMLKLYVQEPTDYYAFDGNFYDWNRSSHSGNYGPSCNSITSLINVVQKEIPTKNTPILDVKTIPLFYTVLEIFSYSTEEIRKIKEANRYKYMGTAEKEHFNLRLQEYRERGTYRC